MMHTTKLMQQPLLSIVIPVYNVEKYLERALLSVIGQTMSRIKIICVDDISTDNSLKILKEFENRDSRIQVVEHSENMGVSTTRNSGLKLVETEHIMFLDPDDWYEPTMCEKMYEKITNNDYNVVACNVAITLDDGMTNNRGYTNDRYYATINSSWVWNKIWKKSILDKYRIRFPDGSLGEDAYFKNCYHLVSNGKVGVIDEKLTNYLIRKNSLMSAFDTPDNPVIFDCFNIGELTYNFYKEHNALNKSYQHYFKSMGLGTKFITEKNYDRAASIIFNSLKTKPQIKVGSGCFVVEGVEYPIKKEVVDRVVKLNSKFNIKTI